MMPKVGIQRMYTLDYGKIEYPTHTFIGPCNSTGYPTTVVDKSFPNKLDNSLQERWIIVHIQRAYDGDTSCPPANGGVPVVNYSLYMDNYGQIWKIYTERGATPEQQKCIISLNKSTIPLTDQLIDLAKTTMSPWLGRNTHNCHQMDRPAIIPKPVLDSFVNQGKIYLEAAIRIDELEEELDDYKKLLISKKND